MIPLIGLLFLAQPQERPPALVHYRPPDSGETQSRFVCGLNYDVRFTIRVDQKQVSIVSYSGAAGPASAEQLAQWNAWLAPMRKMTSQNFVCTGDAENLTIQGTRTQIDGGISVSAYWDNGELRRYPDPYELYPDQN
ncbi:MAG: hypothetical protein Q8S03_03640 [Brevundimonas sp.]|uniref:hypothetical protein n=1 Tax=Brevundimonas sp. TaxID=1871086 RepID=UPI002735CB12|nr:hypothetical protein [Brevundimonas sp.]MDP3403758.1 hypothetical protein [Brevundimonas sp.]